MNEQQITSEKINKSIEYSYYNFLSKIKQIEKEEYKEERTSYEVAIKYLREEHLSELSSWVMRQYFSEKNKNDFWYSQEPTEENVLKFINDERNLFPHTLNAVVEQFKLNKSLRQTLNLMVDSSEKEPEESGVNMVGEVTLKDIGALVGNVSPTMVNKLTDKALEKTKRIFDYLNGPHGSQFKKYYNNIVDEMADIFATSFSEEESLDDALASLLADGIIKQKDLEHLCPQDFMYLDNLFLKSKKMLFSDIEEELINDFLSGERKNVLFQYCVSRIINPDEKSGRRKMSE